MEEEKEMLENVEHALKNFNGRAIDCIAIGEMLIKYKDLKEEVESQDKTIDNLIKEQEEREKYTHSLEDREIWSTATVEDLKTKFIPISVIQNKKRELEKKLEYLKDEYDEGVIEVFGRYSSAIKTLDELLDRKE